MCNELMEDSSDDRLDALIDRARAIFERKYGESKECFAAFSPAKVNMMGDFVEGSGGLVLQVTLDRWVVVFGRGRSLPEYPPPGRGTGDDAGEGVGSEYGNGHGHVGSGRSASGVDKVESQGGHQGEGDGESEDGAVVLNPVPKTSRRDRGKGNNQTSNAGKTLDTIMQQLVFGKKNKRRNTIAPTGSLVTSPAGVAQTTSPLRSGSRRGVSGGGGGGDTQRKMSWSSTPSTSHHDSSASGHGSSSRFSNVLIEHHFNNGDATGGGGGSSGSGVSHKKNIQDGGFNVTPIQIHHHHHHHHEPSSAVGLRERDFHGSVDSGSTTTEEAFPNDSGSVFNSSSSVGGGGRGVGGESGGDGGRGASAGANSGAKTNGLVSGGNGDRKRSVSPVPSRIGSGGGSSSSRNGGAACQATSSGQLSGTSARRRGLSTDADVEGREEEDDDDDDEDDDRHEEDRGSEYEELSNHGPLADEVGEVTAAAAAAVAGDLLRDGDEEAENSDDNDDDDDAEYFPARSNDLQDTVYASTSTNCGGGGEPSPARYMKLPPSEPEIKSPGSGGGRDLPAAVDTAEAEAAEAEAKQLRTCRIFCEACAKDGVVEFSASKGMRGGGDSWQGLMTAVAAEYAQEVNPGEILGLDAVVVSDLPGRQGQIVGAGTGVEAAVGMKGRPVSQEGVGHGWGETARAALLMASATFLEKILHMRSFPRMKALRCFSAAMRCRRIPGQFDGGRKNYSGMPPCPFASEDALAQRWDRDGGGDGGAGGGERGGGGGEEGWAEMSLEDLLAIADGDPPGAVLVDSKSRCHWPIPMRGPNDEGLAVVIAQPLDLEMIQRLRWQAEDERSKGAAACQAVVTVAKERHPEASTLRDVPAETLEALISVGSVRGQGKGSAAAAAAANESWWLAGTAGGSVGQAGGGGGGGGGLSGLSSPTGMGGGGGQGLRAGGALARRKLTPEVLAHARHLAAEVQRVREVATAFTLGDMEAVGRLMLHSRRSAGLSITGSRGRPEPPEPAAARLAAMASRLPGVHGSRQSEGSGSGAAGAVVALVDPKSVEGVLRAISTRSKVATGVAWGGFAARPGGGSGIVGDV